MLIKFSTKIGDLLFLGSYLQLFQLVFVVYLNQHRHYLKDVHSLLFLLFDYQVLYFLLRFDSFILFILKLYNYSGNFIFNYFF